MGTLQRGRFSNGLDNQKWGLSYGELRGYHGDMERYNQQLEVRIVLCLFVILMRMYAPTDQTFACFAHVARCVRAANPRNGMLPQLPFKNAETEVWFKTWDAGVPST